jgi:ribosomal protein S18 acetylase RimI-like enzyme
MQSTIIQATNEHLDLIHQWTLKIHNHEKSSLLKPHHQFSERLLNWLKSEIGNNNTLCLIAYCDKQPLGFILGSIDIINSGFVELNIKGIIKLLWVEPEFRKKQIATRLLNYLEACFKECNIQYIECDYTYTNKEAQSFWKRQGFTPLSISCGKMLS